MALYRTTDNLSTGQRRGQVFRGEALSAKALRILEEKGVIYKINTPPLNILQGWQERATLLKKYEIETVGDLLYADAAEIDDVEAEELKAWQDQAFSFITAPAPDGEGCNCKRR